MVGGFHCVWFKMAWRPQGQAGHGTPAGHDARCNPGTPPVTATGPRLPVVYRWAYDYSVPGADQDFLPQNLEPVVATAGHEGQRAQAGEA